MEKKKIAILLATYNGERYLREQIESLYAQTFLDWNIYVHDDGSSDNSVAILEEYEKNKDNFTILHYPSQHGSKDNFLSLLQMVEADYYFFCDQDDVWLNDKIETSLKRMNKEEQANGQLPIVVFSDLYVTDSNMEIIDESFMRSSAIYPQLIHSFNECAAINIVTGCTMLINAEAKQSLIFPSEKATMHDYWIVLCILRNKGVVSYIDTPLVYYRQHSDNVIGAKDASTLSFTYRMTHLRNVFYKNMQTYKMLKALGYGSVLKYMYYKAVYKYRIYKIVKGNKS